MEIKKCKYCGYETDTGQKLGGHISNCKSNPNYEKKCIKLSKLGKTRKVSNETRKKISESRKRYLIKNPDKVPYLLNHSRKESYPEKYFTKVFDKRNLNLTKGYKIWLYELDFCILNKKIDIEIDGDQHYSDKKIVESDKRRNKYLEKRGWSIIRIKWSDYQKMTTESKIKYIDDLVSYINGLISEKPEFEIPDTNKYCKCGKKIWKSSYICKVCSNNNKREKRPTYEILTTEVKKNGYTATGRKYGVSDNSIRKWIRNYEND